jgi:vacuolar-type H+-ATPase subunit H
MTEVNRGLNEVERRLEEALRNFAGNGLSIDGAVAEITAGQGIDTIGNLTALAVVEASERTAKDIEEAAQAAVSISNDIMAEAQQLAAELRANGKRMGEHLREFAILANKVSTAMRNTRAEVLNSEDPLPRATVLPPVRDGETIQ